MPDMLYNGTPRCFLDVERSHYVTAMLGFYERRNAAAAVDLFEFVYQRSHQKYSVLQASLSAPDPIWTTYRQTLNELMQFVAFHGRTLDAAFADVLVDAADGAAPRLIASTELDQLQQYDCARYNPARGISQQRIDAGRRR